MFGRAWLQAREKRGYARAMRAIARVYEEGRKSSDYEAFVSFLQAEFARDLLRGLFGDISVGQLNELIGGFANPAFSGILFFYQINNNLALNNKKELTLDSLGDYVTKHASALNDQKAIDDTKALILEFVREGLANWFCKKQANQKPNILYTLNKATKELLQDTESNFVTKYMNQIQLENDRNRLKVVNFPNVDVMSCTSAFIYQVKELEKLITQEKYKKYETAILEVVREFKELQSDPEEVLCHYIEILKNAKALMDESENNKAGACVTDQSPGNNDNVFARYTESVNQLMNNPRLASKRKHNMVRACLAIAGVALLVTAIVLVSTLLSGFPLAMIGVAIGFVGAGLISQGHTCFFRTTEASIRSLTSRFKNVGLFAESIKNQGGSLGGQQSLTPSKSAKLAILNGKP